MIGKSGEPFSAVKNVLGITGIINYRRNYRKLKRKVFQKGFRFMYFENVRVTFTKRIRDVSSCEYNV